MDKILELSRELGALLQNEQCYKDYMHAKDVNDNDEELQKQIGEFNLVKLSIDEELTKEERDEEKFRELNTKLRQIYSNIMVNESMQAFQKSKAELDRLVAGIYSVIVKCASGENPSEVTMEDGCSGNCGSCGGCH